jgi:AraC-like DNA-binding protein
LIGLILKLGGLQAILLSVILIKKKINNNANAALAVLVFSLGVSCFLYSFKSLDFYIQFPHMIRVDWGIPLLFGPLIYLYTLFLTNSTLRFKETHFGYFLPYLINIVILIPFFIKSSEEKIQILDYFTASITSGTDLYFRYNFILQIAIAIISVFYALKSIMVLKTYLNKLLNEYSNIQKIKLDWLRLFLYSFFIVSIIFIIVSFLTFNDRYPLFDYNVYYFLFIFILIYLLSFKTLSQPHILSINNNYKANPKVPKKIGYLSNKANVLKDYMTQEKPFLNGELTASELADELKISRHQLSQILNDQLGLNFYDFINNYRVEEFKSRLKLSENNNLTLLGIAYDSGFNSKTTFNTIFKKATGLTPSQYKKANE